MPPPASPFHSAHVHPNSVDRTRGGRMWLMGQCSPLVAGAQDDGPQAGGAGQYFNINRRWTQIHAD